jgi:hypothetical protein
MTAARPGASDGDTLAPGTAFYLGASVVSTPAFRRDPVNALATVTNVYINGFGGDPTLDYRFDVDGQTYTGSGTGGELGNGNVLELKPGSAVAIQYAASDPAISCTCDARTADDWRLPTTALNRPALLLFVPLLGMIGLVVQRWARR